MNKEGETPAFLGPPLYWGRQETTSGSAKCIARFSWRAGALGGRKQRDTCPSTGWSCREGDARAETKETGEAWQVCVAHGPREREELGPPF